MADNAQAAEIDVADPFARFVEEKVVEAPDGAFLAVIGVFFWCVAVYGAIFEGHLVVDQPPHTRTPHLIST